MNLSDFNFQDLVVFFRYKTFPIALSLLLLSTSFFLFFRYLKERRPFLLAFALTGFFFFLKESLLFLYARTIVFNQTALQFPFKFTSWMTGEFFFNSLAFFCLLTVYYSFLHPPSVSFFFFKPKLKAQLKQRAQASGALRWPTNFLALSLVMWFLMVLVIGQPPVYRIVNLAFLFPLMALFQLLFLYLLAKRAARHCHLTSPPWAQLEVRRAFGVALAVFALVFFCFLGVGLFQPAASGAALLHFPWLQENGETYLHGLKVVGYACLVRYFFLGYSHLSERQKAQLEELQQLQEALALHYENGVRQLLTLPPLNEKPALEERLERALSPLLAAGSRWIGAHFGLIIFPATSTTAPYSCVFVLKHELEAQLPLRAQVLLQKKKDWSRVPFVAFFSNFKSAFLLPNKQQLPPSLREALHEEFPFFKEQFPFFNSFLALPIFAAVPAEDAAFKRLSVSKDQAATSGEQLATIFFFKTALPRPASWTLERELWGAEQFGRQLAALYFTAAHLLSTSAAKQAVQPITPAPLPPSHGAATPPTSKLLSTKTGAAAKPEGIIEEGKVEKETRVSSKLSGAALGGAAKFDGATLEYCRTAFFPNRGEGNAFSFHAKRRPRHGVFVGNVLAKGENIAILKVVARALFKQFFRTKKSSSAIFKQLNEALDYQREESYLTGGLFLYDSRERELTFSIAAHRPLLLYRRQQKEFRLYNTQGSPLGFVGNWRPAEGDSPPSPMQAKKSVATYKQGVIKTAPGDLVFLFSEELFKLVDAAGASFDFERIKKVVIENSHRAPASLASSLKVSAEAFSAGGGEGGLITVCKLK